MAGATEIVVGCGDIYVAAVATAFPDVDTTPGAGWTKLGSSGDKNYDEDGVVLATSAAREKFTPAGGTVGRKSYITAREGTLTANIVDLTAAQWAKIMEDVTVTTTPASTGVPGSKSFSLPTTATTTMFAVLFRGTGLSPEIAGLNLDIRLFNADNIAAQEIPFKKDEPAMLKVEFDALEDDSGNWIDIDIQTAAAA